MKGINEAIPFTRRYPDLKAKVLKRDSDIARKLIVAWDIERDFEKVLNIFLKENKNLSDYRFWEMLKLVWVCSGNTDRKDTFLPFFTSKRKQKHYFMTPEEHKRFRELPDKVTAFCACNETPGFSWTLSEEYAFEFQKMFNKRKIVVKEFPKEHLFALIERNGEEELLILN